MVDAVKEVCIFMIIAQAILFFVPGSTYMKYVRVLVGIIMIIRIMEPVLGLFPGEGTQQEIRQAIAMLENSIRSENPGVEIQDQETEIYKNIEEEVLEKLNACDSSFRAVGVDIGETVIIRVQSRKEEAPGMVEIAPVRLEGETEEKQDKRQEGFEKLKKIYGSCLGVEENKIEIIEE